METFQKLERIGRGSFGEVYKGINKFTRETVAIKILDLDTDDDEIGDVQKEISVLSRCDSEHITRYHGSYLIGTKLWIVMDFAAGGSLRSILKSGPLDEKYIAVIAREVLLALVYLHKSAKVIHRDIKAANILLTGNGKVKLCDFGVAGQVSMHSLRRHSFVGTPYWMAPEIIKRAQYDFKRPSAEDLLRSRFIRTAMRGTDILLDILARHEQWKREHPELANEYHSLGMDDDEDSDPELAADDEWVFETIRSSYVSLRRSSTKRSVRSVYSGHRVPTSTDGAEVTHPVIRTHVDTEGDQERLPDSENIKIAETLEPQQSLSPAPASPAFDPLPPTPVLPPTPDSKRVVPDEAFDTATIKSIDKVKQLHTTYRRRHERSASYGGSGLSVKSVLEGTSSPGPASGESDQSPITPPTPSQSDQTAARFDGGTIKSVPVPAINVINNQHQAAAAQQQHRSPSTSPAKPSGRAAAAQLYGANARRQLFSPPRSAASPSPSRRHEASTPAPSTPSDASSASSAPPSSTSGPPSSYPPFSAISSTFLTPVVSKKEGEKWDSGDGSGGDWTAEMEAGLTETLRILEMISVGVNSKVQSSTKPTVH
ncbi:Serine/threonine-protein kinase 25 [Phlyctochytrium planicorne]|nr:Serine/threonine-protein kinase 25 [Phlyctochytrium planicorne]